MHRCPDIKICGLTRAADALAALDLGADYVGFVLYAGSPRGITPAALRRLRERAPGIRNAVGVFVNASRAAVERAAADCGLCAVQLHGRERPEDFEDFPVPVWRAVWTADSRVEPNPATWHAARFLVEPRVRGRYGGTGVTADWAAARAVARDWPVMLAGGLTPENVAAAIRAVHPAGVDASSGVESRPGRKDLARMEAFIAAARSTAANNHA